MRRIRLLAVGLVVAALLGGPAAATTPVTAATWGCAGIELIAGICIENPLPDLGL